MQIQINHRHEGFSVFFIGGQFSTVLCPTRGTLSGLGYFKAWRLRISSCLKPWQTMSETTSRGVESHHQENIGSGST